MFEIIFAQLKYGRINNCACYNLLPNFLDEYCEATDLLINQ